MRGLRWPEHIAARATVNSILDSEPQMSGRSRDASSATCRLDDLVATSHVNRRHHQQKFLILLLRAYWMGGSPKPEVLPSLATRTDYVVDVDQRARLLPISLTLDIEVPKEGVFQAPAHSEAAASGLPWVALCDCERDRIRGIDDVGGPPELGWSHASSRSRCIDACSNEVLNSSS